MKVCSKCREPQDLSDFHKRKGGKDGCTSQCKSCVNKYYEANKQRIKGRHEDNKEKRSEYSKKYSEERPGEMAERTRKWRLDNAESIGEHRKKWYESRKAKQQEDSDK